MRGKFKQILLLILLMNLAGFVIITLVWFGAFDFEKKAQPRWVSWQSPKMTHTIDATSENIKLLWNLSNVFIRRSEHTGFLSIIDDSAYFLGSLEQQGYEKLVSLDTRTGEINWLTDSEDLNPMAFATTPERVFVGYFTAYITSYDVASGEKIWRTQLPSSTSLLGRETATGRPTSIQRMVPANFNLYVNADGPGFEKAKTYSLDTSNGANQPSDQVFREGAVFWIDENYVYSQPSLNRLRSIDSESGEIEWEVEFDDAVFKGPAIANGVIFVKTNRHSLPGKIFAIEQTSGSVLWRTEENVISNVAANDEYIFYLTSNAELWIVNHETGELAGNVKFSPSQIDRENYLREVYVTVDDNFIIVYLGESAQLFAFQYVQ